MLRPPLGHVRLGQLRRVAPISSEFGLDRGMPVDRYYIERFLARHAGPEPVAGRGIRGRVLEFGETLYVREPGAYTARMAGASLPPLRAGVEHADVIDLSRANPQATVVADLTAGSDALEADTYDSVVCTQTLHLIYDVPAALRALERILRPGGTLLVTVPGISQICPPDLIGSPGVEARAYESVDDFWRFTTFGLERLLADVFGPENVSTEAYGNVLTASAFLFGLAAEDLEEEELEAVDPMYQVVVCGSAVKAAGR